VTTSGERRTAADFRETVLFTSETGATVKLGDIATVSDAANADTRIGRFNGQRHRQVLGRVKRLPVAFGHEAPHHLALARPLGQEDLHRDAAADQDVLGLVDRPHAAPPEPSPDEIAIGDHAAEVRVGRRLELPRLELARGGDLGLGGRDPPRRREATGRRRARRRDPRGAPPRALAERAPARGAAVEVGIDRAELALREPPLEQALEGRVVDAGHGRLGRPEAT